MKACLICDDHALMREALAITVRMVAPDIEIHFADTFQSAWGKAQARHDLIICDLTMPGSPPALGIQALLQASSHAPVLIFTANEDQALLRSMFSLGVRGYVAKTASTESIVHAIRTVLTGGEVRPAKSPSAGSVHGPVSLSKRQIEIMQKLALGWSNKKIAAELDMGPATVKTHLSHVMGKLGAANRTEAVSLARKLGLVD